MSDRIFGAACLLLAAVYVYFASQVQLSFMSDPLGPKAFPYIIGGVLALAGLYPILRPDDEPDWPPLTRFLEIVFAVGVMIAYAYLLPDAGFLAATAVASGLLSWRLGATPVAAIVAGLVIAGGTYGIFHLILHLNLAAGPWGF